MLATASSQVPKDRTIIWMSAYQDRVVIAYEPAFTNAEGCGDASLRNYVATIDMPLKAAIHSQALAAFVAGQQVGFGLTGCDTGYGGGVPKIYRIDVDK